MAGQQQQQQQQWHRTRITDCPLTHPAPPLLPCAMLRVCCSVWVAREAVRDLVGNLNQRTASLTIKYRPQSAGLQVRPPLLPACLTGVCACLPARVPAACWLA